MCMSFNITNILIMHLCHLGTVVSPVKGGKRKRKDPNRPKRPTSAYFFFVSKQRQLCEERGEKITRVCHSDTCKSTLLWYMLLLLVSNCFLGVYSILKQFWKDDHNLMVWRSVSSHRLIKVALLIKYTGVYFLRWKNLTLPKEAAAKHPQICWLFM